MPILNAEIVMGSVDVCRNDTGEVTSIFLSVGTIHGVDEAFGISIPFVRWMGWPIVKHRFVDRVGGFVGENASREHRHTGKRR